MIIRGGKKMNKLNFTKNEIIYIILCGILYGIGIYSLFENHISGLILLTIGLYIHWKK